MRDNVSGKRTTPIDAVSASADPLSTSTAVTDVEGVHRCLLLFAERSSPLPFRSMSGTRKRATLTDPTKLINDRAVIP